MRRRRTIDRDWKERHAKIFALNPEYARACPADVEEAHRSLWEPFGTDVRLDTLRVCANVSGRADARFVPEEIFNADIERKLNPPLWPSVLSHKSFYSRWFPADVFPECLLHRVRGQYLDANLEPLSGAAVDAACASFEFPVILKPSTGTSGGAGVCFPKDGNELAREISKLEDAVVQRIIEQHAFFRAFNAVGLNTLRVYTYRSVTTNEIHVLNVALRMGKGGSLDNETAGGIVCFVRDDGSLNDYAVDKYGKRFTAHPDTGIAFAGRSLPDFAGLPSLVKGLAARIPMIRLVGWDVCMDDRGRWRCIEANLDGQTIRFSQYGGQPFFGAFTEEVIDYCLRHPRHRRCEMTVY